MSDYYGEARLEDWLAEEIFGVENVSEHVVKRFEKWRTLIESDIERWLESDDGYGNKLSWRDWGRGFNGVPEEDDIEFGSALRYGLNELMGGGLLNTQEIWAGH